MLLRIQGVTKSFGDNAVLRGVDLAVEAGQVVALVGENGAGKSTLTRVISGVHRPDAGLMSFDEEDREFTGPQAAMACGIQVIYQEFRQNLFPHLSVTDNLFVRGERRSHGRVLVSRNRMRRDAEELLHSIGLDLDPQRLVGTLGVAEQQMVEIAKAIGHDLKLLILDEPTAALDDRESEQLFRQVRRLRDAGVGVLYISHRLDEIFALADRIVVLRDGQVALDAATSDTSPDAVVGAMVGRTVDDFYPKENHVRDEPPALTVRNLSSPGCFTDVSFDVRPGEVLGIAGVLGSGRGDVLRALFGILPRTTGEVSLGGTVRLLSSPRAAIRAGIGYVVPDRGASGLCVQRSVGENISLASLGSVSSPVGIVRRALEREQVLAAMKQLRVRAAGSHVAVNTLSGGNQQKTLFARWLLTRPRVLLMDEPTRGVDVGAKTEIYRIINELTADGVAVVLVSSDLPELVAMSDRVLVMRAGQVATELLGDDVDQQHVLTHALEVAS